MDTSNKLYQFFLLTTALLLGFYIQSFVRSHSGQAYAEDLRFGDLSKSYNIKLPVQKTSWKLPDAPPYKNERLATYQELLRDRGITDPSHLKLLAGQLLAENGALAEDRDGDHGCSVGIPQRYVCQFGYTAKSFRKKYPVWNDYLYQLSWMADRMADAYQTFNGDIRRVILFHNRPSCAFDPQCTDTKAGYFAAVSRQADQLTL